MTTELTNWADTSSALSFLKRGEIVCFPTETVYGIASIASSKEAYDKLVKAKGRPSDKPFTLMCSSIAEAVRFCETDMRISACMKAFMPGEVTFLLEARPHTPFHIDLGTGIIGVRIPNDPNVLKLIETLGEPLLVSSANLSGLPAAKTYEEVARDFGGKVACIIQGECGSGVPSTIVDFSKKGTLSIVREGRVEKGLMADVYRNSHLNVAVGCDHGGFDYKEAILAHLRTKEYGVMDCGCSAISSVDYPEFAKKVANAVADHRADFGIVVCTSGEGVCIAANKVPGIRCGIGYDDVVSGKLREHNDGNVISFGQKYMKLEDVLRRVDIFLAQSFSTEEKHHRRVNEIE